MPSPSMMFTTGTSWVNSIGSGTYSASAIRSATERWCEGVGSAKSFRYLDLEAATEGEYWTIFRGFLLLHRDASLGRGAAQRASGFGSNYNKHELEQRNQKLRSQQSTSNIFSNLKNKHRQIEKIEFSEPEEMTWLYHFVTSNASKFLRWYQQRKNDDGRILEQTKKPSPPPSDYFLGFKSTGTQIWSRLRQAGLETQRIYALDKHRVMIKLRCPPDRLMDVAEVLRVKLKTRDGYFAPFRESTISQFIPSNDMFGSKPSDCNDGDSLFRSSERQLIIDFIIRSRIRDSGAELGQNTDLGKDIEIRAPLHMHAALELLYKGWVLFWKQENWEVRDGRSMDVVSRVKNSTFISSDDAMSFPMMHNGLSIDDKSQKRKMKKKNPISTGRRSYSWVYRILIGSFFQPLDSIEQYFGERVAFYFAWVQHCSVHLVFISILGLATFLFQVCTSRFDHPIRPYFASVVMIWSFLVMVNWRKRQRYLAHRWGTLNYKEEETTRPQYHGVYKQCEITGEWIVHYPSWKRWAKYAISLPLTAAFTVATGIGILMIYANRDIVLARYFGDRLGENEKIFAIDWTINSIGKSEPIESVELTKEQLADPYFWFVIAGFPSILGFALPLLNFLLMKVSISLNEFENYRTETNYRNHLIVKTFAFRFVSNFAALYYYAYMSIGVERRKVENGILRVGTSLFIYVTVSHWWYIFLSIYLPLYIHKWKIYRQRINLREENRRIEGLQIKMETKKNVKKNEREEMRRSLINSQLLLEQAESNVWEEMMLPEHDPFFDYIHVVIQFAYVACFSAVLPLTPLIVLINHLMSMRLNAYKICRGRRRPLAHKTGGIGVWEHVLHCVTVIAVFTNCSLVALTSSQFHIVRETWGNMGLFGVIVGWEHIMLMIKYTMQAVFSKNPKSVDDSIKKEQFEIARKRNFTMRVKKERRSGSYPKPKMIEKSESFSPLLVSDVDEHITPSNSNFDYQKKIDLNTNKTPNMRWNKKQDLTSFRKLSRQNTSPYSSCSSKSNHTLEVNDETQSNHSVPSENDSKQNILNENKLSVQSRIKIKGKESHRRAKKKKIVPPMTPKRETISSEILIDKKSNVESFRGSCLSSHGAISLGENNVKKRIQEYSSRYSHQSRIESDNFIVMNKKDHRD